MAMGAKFKLCDIYTYPKLFMQENEDDLLIQLEFDVNLDFATIFAPLL